MITVPIGTPHGDRSRTVHGVVHLEYDPVRMDVRSKYPDPEGSCKMAEERVPLMACLRNLKRLFGLPAREILEKLRPGEHLQLETDRVRRPRDGARAGCSR